MPQHQAEQLGLELVLVVTWQEQVGHTMVLGQGGRFADWITATLGAAATGNKER